MQKINENYVEEILEYLGFIMKKRYDIETFHTYLKKSRALIANMDEVPVYFDMTRGTTYHFRGEKNIHVIKTLGHKKRCTVVLCVLDDGRKLPPFVIYKSSSDTSYFSGMGSNNRLVVRNNANGWITESMMIVWLERVFLLSGVSKDQIRYLIMDKCSVHEKATIKKRLEAESVLCDYIPGGCTSFLQLLDVCINKPFKDRLREKFEEWFGIKGFTEENRTGKGYLKAPSYEIMNVWIQEAWTLVPEDLVRKSFKYCSNTTSFSKTQSF